MSRNKKLVSFSEIDTALRVLLYSGISHQVSVIDVFESYAGYVAKCHKLRRLAYPLTAKAKVLLEYVELGIGGDDDILYSAEFDLADEPKDWQPVRIQCGTI